MRGTDDELYFYVPKKTVERFPSVFISTFVSRLPLQIEGCLRLESFHGARPVKVQSAGIHRRNGSRALPVPNTGAFWKAGMFSKSWLLVQG